MYRQSEKIFKQQYLLEFRRTGILMGGCPQDRTESLNLVDPIPVVRCGDAMVPDDHAVD